ncbi:hypothetical protein C8R46DRAFT_1097254 [Mycena filopes]|nr:hypothetical protein C8R46DRAFT_1097254 [Mycena filopes]
MSTLPGELVDAIIDWTTLDSSSSDSLAAYALVSKQWLPRSRYYHFASISLTRDRSTDTVKTFLYLLASPLVTFTSSIREVQLHHRSSYAIPVLSAGDIIALLSRSGIFPTRLTLDCHFTQFGLQHTQRNSFPSITHLELSFYGEVSLEKLFLYLLMFPALASLSLGVHNAGSEVGWISMQPPEKTIALPSNLHELRIHQPSILRCLTSTNLPLAQFTTVVLQSIRRFPEVNRYLTNDVVCRSLVSLTLENCITDDGLGLDLSSLAALQHLHVRQHYLWTAPALLDALTSLACAHFPTLATIEVVIYGVTSINCLTEDMVQWRLLDAVLAAPLRWPQLKRVTVCGHTDSGVGVDTDAPRAFARGVCENMPLAVGRGILVLV